MKSVTAAIFTAASLLSGCMDQSKVLAPTVKAPIQVVAVSAKNSTDKDNEELGKFILTLMNMSDVDLSTIRKNMLVRSIVSVSGDILENLDERKQFAVLVGIESGFNPKARSSAGAIGLVQVMPQFAQEFAKLCGAGDVRKEDLAEVDVNLLIGACRFRALMEAANGNVTVALVTYNAGLASNQLKQLKKLREISNKETPNYVTKFHYMREEAEIQMKNVSYTKLDLEKGDNDKSDDSKD